MNNNYTMIILEMLGALGLLIYGMRMMSDALQKMAGQRLRDILSRMTTNRLTGMLTGTLITCAVQSSSATTVMTVSFVSAGLLTLAQAISVIMGANIGTTLTAWIMSLGYSVDLTNVVYPAFLLGIILIYRKKHRYVGDFLFGIAFMFLSLVALSNAGKALDLEHNESVINFFSSFDTDSYTSILAFLAIGTLITCIVQSSAAVMAITIMLCSTGVLPIYLGIALVMGENIGTTATANFAALGANSEARRAALAHLLFNVFGVIWILIVFYPFVDFVCQIVGYDPTHAGQTERLPIVLAMFHTAFNVTNTMVLIGFIPYLERLVCWMIPEKKQHSDEEFRLDYIEGNLMQTPEMSVLAAQKEIKHFANSVRKMFDDTMQLVRVTDRKQFDTHFNDIARQERITDNAELSIARYLELVSNAHLSDATKREVRQMMREISELESVGDSCYNLARIMANLRSRNLNFTAEQYANIDDLSNLLRQSLDNMNEEPQPSLDSTYQLADSIKLTCRRLKETNVNDINNGKYSYSVGTIYNDFVTECGKLNEYVVNVMETNE